MDIVNTARQRAGLILPKLQHMRVGGRNHELLQHIALVQGYANLLDRKTDERVASELIDVCQKAEQYMTQVVR